MVLPSPGTTNADAADVIASINRRSWPFEISRVAPVLISYCASIFSAGERQSGSESFAWTLRNHWDFFQIRRQIELRIKLESGLGAKQSKWWFNHHQLRLCGRDRQFAHQSNPEAFNRSGRHRWWCYKSCAKIYWTTFGRITQANQVPRVLLLIRLIIRSSHKTESYITNHRIGIKIWIEIVS